MVLHTADITYIIIFEEIPPDANILIDNIPIKTRVIPRTRSDVNAGNCQQKNSNYMADYSYTFYATLKNGHALGQACALPPSQCMAIMSLAKPTVK